MFKPYGIIPPVVTPFCDDGSVNIPVYEQLLRQLIGSGVHGVFTLGTCGEFYAVNDSDYRKIIQSTVSVANQMGKNTQVFVGASGILTSDVINKVHICNEIPGIDALSILTPFFVGQTQEELIEHYRRIAGETDIPIIVYNNRPKTNVHVEPETMARLAALCPNIIGIKDSTGDMTNCLEYLRLARADYSGKDSKCGMTGQAPQASVAGESTPAYSVITGRDTLIYSSIDAGAVGSISSCANIAPKLVASIYDEYAAGNREASLLAQMKVAPLRYAFAMGSFPAVVKEALVMEGIPVGKCMAPIGELTAQQKAKLKELLAGLKLI